MRGERMERLEKMNRAFRKEMRSANHPYTDVEIDRLNHKMKTILGILNHAKLRERLSLLTAIKKNMVLSS